MPKSIAVPPTLKRALADAMHPSVEALRRMAQYKLEPLIARYMRTLDERKEFLDRQQHDELMALVAFCQRRTIEKLEARVALKRLRGLLPELVRRR